MVNKYCIINSLSFCIFLDKTLGWKSDILKSAICPIYIIETSIEEISMYKYKKDITNILQNPEFKRKQKYPNDITNKFPEYCMIQYSKFGFVEKAIELNPFATNLFAWVDAGISRFYDYSKLYQFNPTISISNSFYIEGDRYHYLLNTLSCDTYIGTNECIVKGTMMVFDEKSFKNIYSDVMNIFINEMIKKNRIDNEQIALGLVYKNNSNKFTCIQTGNKHIHNIFEYFFN